MNAESVWRPIDMDFYKAWRRIFNSRPTEPDLDDVCPICAAATLHRWYQLRRHAPREFQGFHFAGPGPLWEWCSTCRSYLTFPCGYVPTGWNPPYAVEFDEFDYEPERIEQARLRGTNQ